MMNAEQQRELAELRAKVLTLRADFTWLAEHEHNRRRAATYRRGGRLMTQTLETISEIEIQHELEEAAHDSDNQVARGSEQ